jgi:hypothetical protein
MTDSVHQLPSLCKYCAHWHRLRPNAIVGRCDVKGSRGFSNEHFSCPSWQSRSAGAPAVSVKRPHRSGWKSSLSLFAAELLADCAGLYDASAQAMGL